MGEKKDSFRFTVQFNAGDPSHQQVAAILNEQGRRKAQFLVNAVTHYMNCPETPEAAAVPRIDRQTVEQLVREILSNMHPEPVPAVGEDMPCGDPASHMRKQLSQDRNVLYGIICTPLHHRSIRPFPGVNKPLDNVKLCNAGINFLQQW